MLDGARIAEDDMVLVVSPGEGEIEAVLDALGPDGAVVVVDAPPSGSRGCRPRARIPGSRT